MPRIAPSHAPARSVPDWLARWRGETWRGPLLRTLPAIPGATFSLAGAVGDLRLLTGLAVPWRTVTYRWGLPVHFTAESLAIPDRPQDVKLLIEHDPERPIGYGLSFDPADSRGGLGAGFVVPPGFGADALAENTARLRDGLSIGVELLPETLDALFDAMWTGPATDDDGNPVPIDLAATLRETSLVAVPQFIDARTDNTPTTEHTEDTGRRVGATADLDTAAGALLTFRTPDGSTPMTTAPTIPPTAGVPPTTPAAGDHPAPIPLAELAAQLAPYLAGAGGSAHPAARWSRLSDLIMDARDSGARLDNGARVTLALADQITDNSPGVLPPTWLTEVVGIMDRGRPVVSAFGGPASAGESGMTINWPYYDGDIESLVNEQATEKTEVTTGRVDIKSANAELKTYAGASDISYQLLRRSSPSYREIYARILAIAYAARTDAVMAAALAAVAATNPDNPSWDGSTVESLTGALFTASAVVDDAAGVPGSIALAAPDVFALIGSGLGLLPPVYGTNNVAGTAQASTLRVNVSGLEIVKARHLPAGSLIVSTPEAAKWREDGPYPVEADDVAVLGRDVGIWGMGTTAVTIPAALVSVGVTVPPPLADAADAAGKHTVKGGRG